MKPKSFALTLTGCAVLAAAVLLPRQSAGQAGEDDPKLVAALTEVAAQQTVLTENQAKIEEKVKAIGEEVRVARIFAGRAGGKVK